MSAVKTYLKEETQWKQLGLEHLKSADFYLSPWQKTRSSVPLLIFRIFLFLGTLAIVIASMVYYIQSAIYGFWYIYLTHWGLLAILFATGFGTAVSARCYFYGPISAEFCLPWYIKTFWAIYNVSIPVGFLITIFYWSVLYGAGIEEELNQGLDVAVHALNSVIVFLLLVSSKHPSRLLHFHHGVVFSFTYLVFSLIYHFAGGTNPAGQPWIYPVLDWRNPGPTIGVTVGVGVLLICLHLVTVGLASARTAIATRLLHPAVVVHGEGVPLRQQEA